MNRIVRDSARNYSSLTSKKLMKISSVEIGENVVVVVDNSAEISEIIRFN